MEFKILLFWARLNAVILLSFPVALSLQPECARISSMCPTSQCCCKVSSHDSDGGIEADCARRNLTEVPADLPDNTVEIDLSFNNISSLPADAFIRYVKLRHLKLERNGLRTLNKYVFRGLKTLHSLQLQLNGYQEAPSNAFHPDLITLRTLNLDSNYIKDFPAETLANLHNLKHLSIEKNKLDRIPTEALAHVRNLQVLRMGSNAIETVPDYAFKKNAQLAELKLDTNKIKSINSHAFSGLEKLKVVNLLRNPISSIRQGAFRNLPTLEKLHISEGKNLSEFPDLNGTTNLIDLTIERCSLTSVPEDFCDNMTSLKHLDLHNNQIQNISSFSHCSELRFINLKYNKLSSLEGQLFLGLHYMYDLILSENDIKRISADTFAGLSTLDRLDVSNNSIKEIDEKAFISLKNLQILHLSGNEFPILPTAGLSNLKEIYTYDNMQLAVFPKPADLPSISVIYSSYAYHCCNYMSLPEDSVGHIQISENHTWDSDYSDSMSFNYGFDVNDTWTGIFLDSGNYYFSTWSSGGYSNNSSLYVRPPSNISCKPQPGPFMPCIDLFGSWVLRIGVILVFVLAIIGNAIVMFVILVSHTKMDVPRFLICNLAFADFFLGVYLGFLTGVDISTLGVFQQYGAYWQVSAGCSLAGFLAVFSSEFSIYTLSVITLERFYAIKHALHLEKRMKLPHAVAVMGFGWIFAVVVAILPLVNVSNYYKYPVCLPFYIETTIAKVFVSGVLILNITAFVIIMMCYASIYLAIQGSHAWNCNDSRVARRMSLLVFTDFACWAPITFFSLTSALGLQLISLEGAKVLTIFVLPLNSCANPFLYTILTKQFKKDCKMIMRSLSNQVFRQRSMSRSITLSLGRHPSLRSTQAHQISQLRWRTNGSISQDVTGDACMVSSFRTENGEPSSNVYTVSTVAETHTAEQSNGSCSNDRSHSHSDSSAALDPMLLTSSDLDDLRRGSTSPLLDLMTQVKSKVNEVKPRPRVRRKFSIPFPFFSSHSPNKSVTGTSSANTSMRSSPSGYRQKRSYSVTEGLLHKMGRKKPLTSMKSAPGISTAISTSTENLNQESNGGIGAIRINIPGREDLSKVKTEGMAEDPKAKSEIQAVQEPRKPSPQLFNSPEVQDYLETQGLLEVGRSSNEPSSSKYKPSDDTQIIKMLSAHENPVRDELSSATPSPLLHRPENLELDNSADAADKDTPDEDSGVGTTSSPTESVRFLPDSLHTLKSQEGVCNAELDHTKNPPSGLGTLFGNLTRADLNRCYNEVPNSPTKASQEICRPKESIV